LEDLGVRKFGFVGFEVEWRWIEDGFKSLPAFELVLPLRDDTFGEHPVWRKVVSLKQRFCYFYD
jgi:hypothetical protein